jgi:hypothetical protein
LQPQSTGVPKALAIPCPCRARRHNWLKSWQKSIGHADFGCAAALEREASLRPGSPAAAATRARGGLPIAATTALEMTGPTPAQSSGAGSCHPAPPALRSQLTRSQFARSPSRLERLFKFTPARQARSARLHTTRQRRLILLASLAGVSLEEARRRDGMPQNRDADRASRIRPLVTTRVLTDQQP